MLDLDMRGKDEDGDVREFRANLAGCLKAFGRVSRRHPDVHDHQFGLPLADEREQQSRVCGLPYDVKARAFKQARETLAQQDVVVCEGDLDSVLGHLNYYGPFSGSTLRSDSSMAADQQLFTDTAALRYSLVRPPTMLLRWIEKHNAVT